MLILFLFGRRIIFFLISIIIQRNIHANGCFFAAGGHNMHEIINSLNNLTPTSYDLVTLLLQLQLLIYFSKMTTYFILGLAGITSLTSSKGTATWPIIHFNKFLLSSHRFHMSCMNIVNKGMYTLRLKLVHLHTNCNLIPIISVQMIHKPPRMNKLPIDFIHSNSCVFSV